LIRIGAGDVVQLSADQHEGESLYRVDRVELGALQIVEGVRIEPGVYAPSDLSDELASVDAFVPPVPLTSTFLDLPLITGDEVPQAPYLAATGTPWPGSVAVYQSATDEDFALNSILTNRATIGFTQNALVRAKPGLIDLGPQLEVQFLNGTLSSATNAAFLNGANLMAIGDGSPDNWELFQFRDAELLSDGQYLLGHRLRGQLGTDAFIPEVWPEGSWVVAMNGAPQQIELLSSLRRIAQTFRIGPAQRAVDDPIYRQVTYAFDGNGLRPYAPVHLDWSAVPNGLGFTWIRRTRIEGDSWDLVDVPLGEESESYTVRVQSGSAILREETVGAPQWTYPDQVRAGDGAGDTFTVSVAQNSARYGPGPFRAVDVNLS